MNRSIGRNALINLIGSGLQIVVLLVTTPLYIHRIGTDRYGILALVWVLLGYFGLFDMGLGAATTTFVARLRGAARRSSLFWTALTINLGMGCIGAIAMLAASAAFAFVKMPPGLRPELHGSFGWLALAVMVAVLSSVIAGSVTGRERFVTYGACQLAGMIGFTVAPLIAAFEFGPDLRLLIPVAVLARTAATVPLAIAAWRFVPLGRPRFERRWIPWLFRFGGWMTVTNLISPLLIGLDRFFIGAISGSAAVTYYTVPFNFAARLSVIPGSLSAALYPRFARLRGAELDDLIRSSLLSLAAIMTPIVVVGMFVMKPFLWRWLGPALGDASAPVGETILIGVWINGLAFIPFTMLNAGGKPGVVARFHIMEILPLVFILWLFLKLWGVEGAAWAWTLRVSIDAALLFAVSRLPWRDYAPLVPPALIVLASAAAVRLPGAQPLPRVLIATIAMVAAAAWSVAAAPPVLKLQLARIVRRRLTRNAA